MLTVALFLQCVLLCTGRTVCKSAMKLLDCVFHYNGRRTIKKTPAIVCAQRCILQRTEKKEMKKLCTLPINLIKFEKKFAQYHFLSEPHFQSLFKLLNLLDTDVNTSHTFKFSLYLGQGVSTKHKQAHILVITDGN